MTPRRPIGSLDDSLPKPLLPCALLLIAWESDMTPMWPEYTKTPPQTDGYSYFFIEKIAYHNIINNKII
jgi:hypothetical protein